MDIKIENEGSIFLFRPLSEAGRDWLRENVEDGEYFGRALVVEHSFARELAHGLISAGLRIS